MLKVICQFTVHIPRCIIRSYLDPHDRFFEQENNLEFFATNVDPQTTAGPIRRRVSSLFGDTQTEGRYYEPQKITEDTLLDVRIPNR